MQEISNKGIEQHQAVGFVEVDNMVFTCPKCPGYIRKINWKTGKMAKSENPSGIPHAGSCAPGAGKQQDINQN